jgi:N-acetylneuraminate lyase
MRIQKLEGLIAAPFTPMHPDGTLNTSLIPDYYRFLKRNKVAGAFINGSTGEGVSQSMEEKKAVVEAWVASRGDDRDFRIITLVGGTCLEDGATLAVHAAEAGLDGVALTAPFYFKPRTVGDLAACCTRIAEAVPDMPVYYYHIPVLTGVDIPMLSLLEALHDKVSNFAGVKYTHEDFMDFLSCLNYRGGRYDMLWGRDENMLSALVLGARGSVGSTFNYAAPLYHRLIDAFDRNDLAEARALQQTAIDMIRLLGKYGGIATGKAYMRLVGLDCGGFRLPVRNMDEEAFTAFREDVSALGFRDFKSV